MSRWEPDRVARAFLMGIRTPGDENVAVLVAEAGPVLAAQHIAAAAGVDWRRAEVLLATAEAAGVRLLTPEDDDWPAAMPKVLPTDGRGIGTAPPLGLWVRGTARLDQLTARAVCVAGTGNSTPYGERAAFDLGGNLAAHGWTVITSGGFGISGSVIRGALAAGGPVLVLPPAPLTHRHPDRAPARCSAGSLGTGFCSVRPNPGRSRAGRPRSGKPSSPPPSPRESC